MKARSRRYCFPRRPTLRRACGFVGECEFLGALASGLEAMRTPGGMSQRVLKSSTPLRSSFRDAEDPKINHTLNTSADVSRGARV